MSQQDFDGASVDFAGMTPTAPDLVEAALRDLALARTDYYRLKGVLQAAHGALADGKVPDLLIPGAFDDPLAPTIAKLCADLALARAVLDSMHHPIASSGGNDDCLVWADRAAWLAWQNRGTHADPAE